MLTRLELLTLDEATHEYRLDGAVIPSVTQLLNRLHSFAGVPEAILEAARERGTAAHKATQFYDEDDLDEETLAPSTAGYLAGWKKFRQESACVIRSAERMGHHPLYRFAGQWDRDLEIAGIGWTVDIKTAAEYHWCWGLQTAAYNAIKGRPSDKRATVQLRANGDYRFLEWKDADDYPAFLSLATLFNKVERHARERTR